MAEKEIRRDYQDEIISLMRLGKMRPLPATASQGKSPVPP